MKNDPMKVKYAEGGSLLNPIEREQYSIGSANQGRQNLRLREE
jgi:hypothetical protein